MNSYTEVTAHLDGTVKDHRSVKKSYNTRKFTENLKTSHSTY